MKFVNQKSLFKIIGASALATCMLATSLFAFIPNSTQAETLNSNQSLSNIQSNTSTTESTGLITPRADDPVLFTTESGLEIKYGSATLQGDMSSGNLTGFPYFRTTKNNTNYDWVLIGSRYNEFLRTGSNDAETAILSDVSSLLEVQIPVEEKIVIHDEIPENCYLVLLNNPLTSMTSGRWSTAGAPELYISFYNNDTFGFGSDLQYVMETTIHTTLYRNFDGVSTEHFFAFGTITAGYDDFGFEDYLSADQRQCNYAYALRSYAGNVTDACVSQTGSFSGGAGYVRPIFVFSWHALK